MKIKGSCVCGNIAYEAEVDADDVSLCNCTDCQKFSGSAFRVGVLTDDSRFTLLRGTLKEYVKTAESGGRRVQAFCPECGTHLYSTSERDGPKVLRLRTSTANQRDLLVPRKQGWMRSAQKWLRDLPKLPGVEKQH
ncbi:MAG: GFA family protein [Alphaproteobacteria bacterium]|jgi:hypothetical protein